MASPQSGYANVQRKFDAELNRMLERAARDIQARIARLKIGVGGDVRAAQLRLVLNEIRNVQQIMWNTGVLTTVVNGRKAAAKAAEDAIETLERVLYTALPERVAQGVRDGLRATALAGIERDHARVPRALSSRVYHDFALTSGRVEEVIRSGIISGLSARELAKDVYQYISPTVPGGASYAAMRLARTEINNSFHEQQIKGGQRPGVKAVIWNLSGSHRKPDLCNVYASQNVDGLGRGKYEPGNVPSKPHPQCLCFLTYDTMSAADFAKAIKAGKFDDELDRRIAANLKALGRPAPSKPAKKSGGKKAAKKAAPKPPPAPPKPARVFDPSIIDRTNMADKVYNNVVTAAELTEDKVGDKVLRIKKIRMHSNDGGVFDPSFTKVPRAFGAAYQGEIRFDPGLVLRQSDLIQAQLVHWHGPAAGDPITNVAAHEMGHALTNGIFGIVENRAVMDAVAQELGIVGPGGKTFKKWLQTVTPPVEALIETQVSRYATKSLQEFIAEVWSAYTTNRNASAFIKNIGAEIERLIKAGP